MNPPPESLESVEPLEPAAADVSEAPAEPDDLGDFAAFFEADGPADVDAEEAAAEATLPTSARLKSGPAAMATTFVRPVGTAVVPSMSWPQAITVPLPCRPRPCTLPAATAVKFPFAEAHLTLAHGEAA